MNNIQRFCEIGMKKLAEIVQAEGNNEEDEKEQNFEPNGPMEVNVDDKAATNLVGEGKTCP